MAQDEAHINADLLALADDDESDSDVQSSRRSPRKSRSPTPARSPSPARKSSRGGQQKRGMASKGASARSRRSNDEDDEASGAESLGSGAMSESESDTAPAASAADGPLFPVEGRFRDEAERARIMALPEVERESFLADRSEEVQQAAQSAQLRQLMASRARKEPPKKRRADVVDEEETPRKRTAKTKTSENIANYKKMREERQERRARGGDRKVGDDEGSPARSDQESDRDRRGRADSDEVEWDDRRRSPVRREPPADLPHFQRVRVGRSNFAKVCYFPGFEDAIKGCFCRVAIGPDRATGGNQYRMTQIKGFTTGREYKMEAQNGREFKTTQYAILAHGKAEKEWPFIACSDGPITPGEYDRFLAIIRAEDLRAPTASYLNKKCQDITDLLNHKWTDAEISQKLKRQGWLAGHNQPSTAAASSEPQPLEPIVPTAIPDRTRTPTNGVKVGGVPTQQERLAALNNRNRRANAEDIRKAQIEERKRALQLQAAMEKGDATANPFARTKTRARVHYDADRKLKDDLFGESGDSRAATPIPAEKKETSNGVNGSKLKPQHKKRVMDDEAIGALDLGIDIEI